MLQKVSRDSDFDFEILNSITITFTSVIPTDTIISTTTITANDL